MPTKNSSLAFCSKPWDNFQIRHHLLTPLDLPHQLQRPSPSNAQRCCHQQRWQILQPRKRCGGTTLNASIRLPQTNLLGWQQYANAWMKTSDAFFVKALSPCHPNRIHRTLFLPVQEFLRRQRNPLLDRISFYARRQERGESFGSFFAALQELHHTRGYTDASNA